MAEETKEQESKESPEQENPILKALTTLTEKVTALTSKPAEETKEETKTEETKTEETKTEPTLDLEAAMKAINALTEKVDALTTEGTGSQEQKVDPNAPSTTFTMKGFEAGKVDQATLDKMLHDGSLAQAIQKEYYGG